MKIKNYLACVFDGMVKGLFASLIIGVILTQIGDMLNIAELVTIGRIAQFLMGPAIGVGVAYKRNASPMTLLASAVCGLIGAGAVTLAEGVPTAVAPGTLIPGEPLGAFLAALVGVEIGKLIEGRTKFDLMLVPLAVIIAGGIAGLYVSPFMSAVMRDFGAFVNELTRLHPIPMGILIAVIVGSVLTLPLSSAALCIAIGIEGIAAGAALVGCAVQMVGFATISFRENKISGLLSQGLGTAKIQFPNIIKNPLIWVPTLVVSAILGPVSTVLFEMQTNSVGAGMGTSSLVGQITTLATMTNLGYDPQRVLIKIAILHFALPAVLCLTLSEIMRRAKLIKFGDMKIES